ncbi:unnamed protein product [Mytilus coruscus]|uniref:Zinc finger PHD-type domain-containing protein n=1 Tax=Mytilus coruscus TaxID=42192 RepID=A0A6J8D7Y0_MYTCO|nr:unnamed protein product [Mytilus coruscus]
MKLLKKLKVIEQELSWDKTEIKYPLPEDFVEKTLQNFLFQNPETEQQKLQNCALSALQSSIADTKSYIQYVWEKFSGLIESANLNSQDITNKNLSNLYKLINKELTSEENKLRVSSLFGHNPSENEFNLIYRITSTEIERKQNIRRGLTHASDKCIDFFIELDVKVQKLQTSANLNIHGSKFPNFIKNVLRNDKDLKSTWTHLFLEFRKEVSSDILDSVFEEILDRYTLMSIAQLRKEYLEKKHTRKLEATRKQIKLRTEGKKSNPCTMETIKNDTSSKKMASHRRLQSELLSNVTFLKTNFKKTELNVLCLAYNMKGFSFFELLESSTSAQQHLAETNPLSESVDHLEEQPEQVSEITNQPGAASDREEEGGQSKYASSDSVGCDRCDTWYHAVCLKIDDLENLGDPWHCQPCIADIENESDE